jgi:hypothetical protein
MLAYNKEWLDNRTTQQEAAAAFEQHCISQEERDRINQACPVPLYTPNIYIRIGLFLLTLTVVLFSLLLLIVMFREISGKSWQAMLIFSGLIAWGALELAVRDRKHYHSGVDDALLVAAVALLLTGIIALLPGNGPYAAYCLLIFAVTAFAALRFASWFMTVAAVLSLLAGLFYASIHPGSAGRIAAPLLLTAASYVLYALVSKTKGQTKLRRYRACRAAAEVTTLVTGCLCVNYFVVREAGNAYFNLDLQPGQSIPGAWLFWLCTVLIPLAYIAAGVWKKNVILLRTGLLLIAAMVFTIKYYHHLAPIELEMTAGGLALIAVAYVLIRYLRIPRHGFTGSDTGKHHLPGKAQSESLTIAETFSGKPAPEQGFGFGGGSGGGGGAQGGW